MVISLKPSLSLNIKLVELLISKLPTSANGCIILSIEVLPEPLGPISIHILFSVVEKSINILFVSNAFLIAVKFSSVIFKIFIIPIISLNILIFKLKKL